MKHPVGEYEQPPLEQLRAHSREVYAELPEELSAWDRFWYRVVYFLGFVQELILWRVVREPCWRSRDGRVFLIRKMGDRHLSNAARMLWRNGDVGSPYYIALRREINRRGLRLLS